MRLRTLALTLVLAAPALPAKADFLVGIVAYDRGDYATAFDELSAPDTRNVPEAKFFLGRMYLFGSGVAADPEKGIALLRESAEAGVLDAAISLAQAYDMGRTVPKDRMQGYRYWLMAAELGHGKAMLEVGLRLEGGETPTGADPAAAAAWFGKAAAAGEVVANAYLGELYEQGRGVIKHLAEAERLYRLAAGKGSFFAMDQLARFLLEQGRDLEEAKQYAELAVAREGQPLFHVTLGRILEAEGDTAGAEAQYREAAEKSPLYAQPRELLGDLLWSQGRKLEAEALWRAASQLARDGAVRDRLERKLLRAF
jgi:tetratricopeptide (TPR) repeat protein